MSEYGFGFDDDNAGDSRRDTGQKLFAIELCSGEEVLVMTAQEKRWFDETKLRYLNENKFEQVTDYLDLDRLLVLELSLFRWTQHIASGRDYENNLVDDDLLRKQIKDQSDAITKLKQSLGLDKKAREAALAEGNFNTWFTDAKRRAKLFGIHRETQLNKALSLMNELSGIVGAFDRSDEEERKKLGYADETAIIAWVRDSMIPDFKAVDEHFIENEQKLWKRDL